MSELHTRVRNYLDKKKPPKVESVTIDVTIGTDSEDDFDQAWRELKDACRGPARVFKAIVIVLSIIVVLWAMANIGISNDCYLDKECREWVKNR
jgi:hypothetical protein